jgi:hypothetical protein
MTQKQKEATYSNLDDDISDTMHRISTVCWGTEG